MPIPKDISIRHTPAKAGKRSQNENYMEHMDEGSHRRESKGLPTQRGRQSPGWGVVRSIKGKRECGVSQEVLRRDLLEKVKLLE